jgi:hypothetical protein
MYESLSKNYVLLQEFIRGVYDESIYNFWHLIPNHEYALQIRYNFQLYPLVYIQTGTMKF